MTKVGRRHWGWWRGGRKAIALPSSELCGPELSICASLSGVQGLLLTLIAVAIAIRCNSPDQ